MHHNQVYRKEHYGEHTWHTVQLTVPICRSQSNAADTVLSELQNGQLKNFSSFGRCFFGGGLLLLRLPIVYSSLAASATGHELCLRTTCSHVYSCRDDQPWTDSRQMWHARQRAKDTGSASIQLMVIHPSMINMYGGLCRISR